MGQIFLEIASTKKDTSQSVQVMINTERDYKQFIYLITPDSAIMSEFNHICSVGDY
jgi:hypothetical protein